MTGYESKKAAAQDKLNDDDLTIAYQSGYYDGKKAAQEPVAMLFGSLPVYDTDPSQPAQEPVAWADIQKEAQQIVESKFLWKKFIDGTPLSNDIACWMADFAQQYTAPPQRTWVDLTEEEIDELRGSPMKFENSAELTWVRIIEAALRSKNNG